MNEDKKDAVGIGVNLSGQLIAACLTMIAVMGAFVTFSFDKKDFGPTYLLIVGGAFGAFIASIFLGGLGIDRARKSGFDGKWTIENTRKDFNLQALFAFAGIFAFVISVFIGSDKPEKRDEDIKMAYNKISALEDSLRAYSNAVNNQNIQILALQRQIYHLRDALLDKHGDDSKASKNGISNLPKH